MRWDYIKDVRARWDKVSNDRIMQEWEMWRKCQGEEEEEKEEKKARKKGNYMEEKMKEKEDVWSCNYNFLYLLIHLSLISWQNNRQFLRIKGAKKTPVFLETILSCTNISDTKKQAIFPILLNCICYLVRDYFIFLFILYS